MGVKRVSREFEKQIKQMQDQIEKATGKRPPFYECTKIVANISNPKVIIVANKRRRKKKPVLNEIIPFI